MRAATIREQEIVIEEHPDPVAQAGEVLVRVHAAGLNGADMMQRRGQLLTELHRELFHQLHAQTAAERTWAIRTQDSIPLRQSA